jgi:DNA-directed RNA polymerase subunit M/transcription elongation factor TFIIS
MYVVSSQKGRPKKNINLILSTRLNSIKDIIKTNKNFRDKLLSEFRIHALYGLISNPFPDIEFWKNYKIRENRSKKSAKNLKPLPNTSITCRKCGGGIIVTDIQMRRGDESATSFYSCIKCGFVYRK